MADDVSAPQHPTRRPTGPTRRLAAVAALMLVCVLVPATAMVAVAGPSGGSDQSVTVAYTPSDEVIANPQRGFYRHTETHAYEDGSGYSPLDVATLRGYRAEGITQILRIFYLEKFADSPALDPQWLALVQADFATARAAGVSVIVRFAYTKGAWPYLPPYGDAPVEVVLAHIAQLGPVLRENSDVIATVQAGFIGLWGEWYYTDNFVAVPAYPARVNRKDWRSRAAVVRALLRELPSDTTVQLRTMQSKQRIFGVPTGAGGALSEELAYDGSDLARVGHHNDCFLASSSDFGTFRSYPADLDEEYLARDTRFVPMGGETCSVNPPRSLWETASALMSRYHYSYLNRDYNPDVLESWGAEGIAETARRLGYRFGLESSTVKAGTLPGELPTVRVDVRNQGWAAPYNERPVRLVLENAEGSWAVPFVEPESSVPADARWWGPGTSTTVVARPCGVPGGSYQAYLELPSSAASLQGNPDYSIMTANVGTWVGGSGWNDLQQQVLVPDGGPAASECGDLGAVRRTLAGDAVTVAGAPVVPGRAP